MRLILSRKGFDSSAGGCPSPIFPDGTFYALPIPDGKSRITYGDLKFSELNIGKLVEDLSRGRYGPDDTAHLDPDMHLGALPRQPGWRPLLGQTGAAQGHLRKQGVTVGDLLLFFGLFRPVVQVQGHWRFIKEAPARHMLWGWLQIGEILKVDDLTRGELKWARYHPHFQIKADPGNTLYLASDSLSLDGDATPISGAGTFLRVNPQIILTHPDSKRPSFWRLPRFMFPAAGRQPLSYHTRLDRWSLDQPLSTDYCNLQSAARGQEFTLNMKDHPEASAWVKQLILTTECDQWR